MQQNCWHYKKGALQHHHRKMPLQAAVVQVASGAASKNTLCTHHAKMWSANM